MGDETRAQIKHNDIRVGVIERNGERDRDQIKEGGSFLSSFLSILSV